MQKDSLVNSSQEAHKVPEASVKTDPMLSIIHFNDVYDIQPRNKDGLWGIANFEAEVRRIRKEYPTCLLLFSGDCFSPSTLTNIYEGEQMVFALNKLKIDVACYGNHEFDLESQQTLKLAKQCNFPWLLGNIRYRDSEFILGDAQPYFVKQINNGALKIGFFGVAGSDWLGILGDEYEDELVYDDYIQHSKKMCKVLKEQHNCHIIIALTHMRVPEDKKLPQEVPDIDIVLGGHDHIVMEQLVNRVPVIKSGDNFKSLSLIHAYQKVQSSGSSYKFEGHTFNFDQQLIKVPVAVDADTQLIEYVDHCMDAYRKHDRVVGYTDVELQTRFSKIRTQQTNYGNFVADLVRNYYDIEVCVLNSGGVRIDSLIKPGPLCYSTISNIINDILVVKLVSGRKILEALEYACSSCPDVYAGSFLLVSGIRYTYDYRANPRVQEVFITNQKLDLQRTYTLATHSYIANGGDGFEMFKECEFQVDPIASIDMLSLLLKFFKGYDKSSSSQIESNIHNTKGSQMNSNSEKSVESERQSSKKDQNNTSFEKSVTSSQQHYDLTQLPLNLGRKLSVKLLRMIKLRNRTITDEQGNKFLSIAPTIEGRIKSLYP